MLLLHPLPHRPSKWYAWTPIFWACLHTASESLCELVSGSMPPPYGVWMSGCNINARSTFEHWIFAWRACVLACNRATASLRSGNWQLIYRPAAYSLCRMMLRLCVRRRRRLWCDECVRNGNLLEAQYIHTGTDRSKCNLSLRGALYL